MLEELRHLRYAPHILEDWEQFSAEGADVESLRELAVAISRLTGSEGEKLAREAEQLMAQRPVRKDFRYEEPTAFEDILAARPPRQIKLGYQLSDTQWRDKLAGAWIGRMSGCLLGKPLEGIRFPALTDLLRSTGNYPMTRYITSDRFDDDLIARSPWPLRDIRSWADKLDGIYPVDDDTNYPILSLRLMQNCGWAFQPGDVLENWMGYVPYLQICTAERIAYRNAATGLPPPRTATYCNPYREMVGARIRVDFYGYVAPGDPALAAELAFRDASVSHVKNGVYSAMYVAAMIAAAAVCGDPETIVAAGLEQIPLNCRHRAGMEQVLAWYREGRSAEQTIEAIHSLYDENRFFGWCSAISNDMVCTAALLYGAGDFGRSICLTVQAAYDTDSNGATVGSIAGIMCGKSGIDLCWTQPYGDRLHTLVQDYAEVTVDTLVERTQAVIDARAR